MLRAYDARFSTDDGSGVGRLTGWLGWRVIDEHLANAADSISADAAYIGYVAGQLLDDEDNDSFIEDVVLIDRISIEPEFRGHGLLRRLVESLVVGLRLHINGCYLITEPEPQQVQGGPYPEGATRDRAMSGLVDALRGAGFRPWTDGRAHWRRC